MTASTPIALSDDELALLRFTCDLFFVEESPLWAIEQAQKEPVDYAGTYHGLVERGLVDPTGFRITDGCLNRLAPVTECDARVVHITTSEDGHVEQDDYYLLDEIAVRHAYQSGKHLFGPDLDAQQLAQQLARHFVPRRAAGERIDVVLTALEFLALSILLEPVRMGDDRCLPLDEVELLLGKAPTEPVPLPALLKRPHRPRPSSTMLVNDPAWDEALHGLVEKRVYRLDGRTLWLRAGLVDLCRIHGGDRHTFVRYDFGDGDWLVRETTLLPVDGSLFFIGPRRGGIAVEELDGTRLRAALLESTGPLPRDKNAPIHQRLSDLLRREPRAS